MTNSPLKNYGFTYEYNGKDFAFHICAESEQEAISRAAAMGSAELFGELQEDSENAQAAGDAADTILFEILGKDGHVWRIHESGIAEGFPEGSFVMNHAAPAMDYLRGRIKHLKASLAMTSAMGADNQKIAADCRFRLYQDNGRWFARFSQEDGSESGGCGDTPEKAIDGAARAITHTIGESSKTKPSCG